MATENAFITSLKDNMKWSDVRLSAEEKPQAKNFCYKITSGPNDILLRLLLIVALAFHGYNYLNVSRLIELAPTVEQCSPATVTAMKKDLDMVKMYSVVGMVLMAVVILLSNFIEMMDIKLRGPAHILVSLIMLVLFILDIVMLNSVKSKATNNCTVSAPSPADLNAFKKIVSDCTTYSGIGIGASVAWMGYYGYRIYADSQGIAPLTASSLRKSASAALNKA